MTDFLIDNTKARENNQHTLAIYLELAKAFDTIDHELLINKLEYYGVQGQSLDWFEKGISSDNQCITCWVLQGPLWEPFFSQFTQMT